MSFGEKRLPKKWTVPLGLYKNWDSLEKDGKAPETCKISKGEEQNGSNQQSSAPMFMAFYVYQVI